MDDQDSDLEAWFAGRGYDLYYDRLSDESGRSKWLALAIPHGQRIGTAASGSGETKIEAAGALKAQLEAQGQPAKVVEIGQAVETDIAMPITPVGGRPGGPSLKTVTASAGLSFESLQEVSTTATLPYEVEIPDNVRARFADATAFGWQLGFVPEPDGSFMWAAIDREGNVLQTGIADSWDDARLDSITELYPPSDEAGG